jgi:pimeloyl-ACP methyl ester carboxylesterase
MGPILAENYTVIAVDKRGMGDSTLPANNDYSAETIAGDLKGVLDFLNITEVLVFAHDKGCGPAMGLAAKYPGLVKAIGVGEYGLPGFGYEIGWVPSVSWSLYSNWQLAFFSVPDAAEFFVRGREKEMLR